LAGFTDTIVLTLSPMSKLLIRTSTTTETF
jgi:hypothetical protein